VNRSHTLCIKS